MNKRVISKVGKRHRPEIDMMEYIQTEENREFDLDSETLTLDDIDSLLSFGEDNDEKEIIKTVKKKSIPTQKNTRQEPITISEYVELENEHNDQLVDIIENNEV